MYITEGLIIHMSMLLTHSNNLHILSDQTSFYGLKLIKVYGPKYWNTIPNQIRSIASLVKIILKGFETVFIANIFLILLNHMFLLLPFQSYTNLKLQNPLVSAKHFTHQPIIGPGPIHVAR